MKLIDKRFKNAEHGFTIHITTCNSKLATAKNESTGEVVKFNRPKLEYMINKKIFIEVTNEQD